MEGKIHSTVTNFFSLSFCINLVQFLYHNSDDWLYCSYVKYGITQPVWQQAFKWLQNIKKMGRIETTFTIQKDNFLVINFYSWI